MVAFKIDTFGGMTPAVDDRLLPERAAAYAENTWLYAGRLSGVQESTLVRSNTPGTAKVFRIPNNYVDADHLEDALWMEFQDPDTDVVRALVIEDAHDRYYWAARSHAPKYNTKARLAASLPGFTLGVPQPELAALEAVGGAGADEVRAYLTTWVSAYGEEGPASTPVLLTGKVDASWNLTLAAAADADLGVTRNLSKTRIYRTVTSSGGVATYFLVAEIPIETLIYSDVFSDAVVSSNNILESTNWIGPPDNLAGFISMPNGILAGWSGNELRFCEPYRPHAWPAAYALVVDFPIVGLGVTNQTLVVCTQGYPMTASGIHPASIALSKSASLEPCQSRGSILSTTEGVYYASPNGLVFAGAGSITNITRSLITKDKWQKFITIPTLRAASLGTGYYAYGSAQAGVFDPLSFDTVAFAQENFTGAYAGILIEPVDQRVAFSLLSDTTPITNLQNDPWSGETFIIQGDETRRINLAALNPVRRVYLWRSKIFQTGKASNLAALRIYWNETPAPSEAAPIPNTFAEVEFPRLPEGSQFGVVRVFANDKLVLTRDLAISGEIIRLPSGFKADFWQFELETFLDVYSLQIGTSVKALQGA